MGFPTVRIVAAVCHKKDSDANPRAIISGTSHASVIGATIELIASFSDHTSTYTSWSCHSARRYDVAASSSAVSTLFHDGDLMCHRVPSAIHS